MTSTDLLYHDYHQRCPFADFGKTTFQGDKAFAAYSDARSALDFGCGNGYAVRRMRAEGHCWFGVEFSRTAYDLYLREPYFYLGGAQQFADRQFDMVYSTEVFEHIPVEEIDETVRNVCRVAAKYLFLTISLRPSSDNNRYHCTLRPRRWWEERFVGCGFVVDRDVIDCFQPRTLRSTRAILSRWADFGPDARAFCENPPYRLLGEKQFWYFAFRRRGVAPRPLPAPTEPWHRRRLIPWARRRLRFEPPHLA